MEVNLCEVNKALPPNPMDHNTRPLKNHFNRISETNLNFGSTMSYCFKLVN